MARGRNPQFSLEDLLGFMRNTERVMAGGGRLGPKSKQLDAAEYLIREGANLGTYATPFTKEELGRLSTEGADRGHFSSLALYLALMRANRIPAAVKGAARAYRGTKDLFRDSGMSPQRAKLPAARNNELIRE